MPEKEKTIQCDQCEKKFRSKPELDRHMRSTHEVNPMPCDICGKVFQNQARLTTHVKVHTRPATRRQVIEGWYYFLKASI